MSTCSRKAETRAVELALTDNKFLENLKALGKQLLENSGDIESLNRGARKLVDLSYRDPAGHGTYTREAARALRRALELNPNDPVSLTNYGALWSHRGHHRKALEHYKSAELLGYQDRNLFFNIGVAMMNSNALGAKAMPYFEKAGKVPAQKSTWEAYFDPYGHQIISNAPHECGHGSWSRRLPAASQIAMLKPHRENNLSPGAQPISHHVAARLGHLLH